MNDENYKIMLLRNETSLFLDDLVALVVNSTMAFNLRNFSSEVMELTPGFAFNLKQAKKLREATQKTLKQYQAKTITDGDLMNFLADARTILKNDDMLRGESIVGFIKPITKLFQGKKQREQESMDSLERKYENVCQEMLSCEEEMARCVEASNGHPRDSMEYRTNARTYNRKKDELTLLRRQEQILSQSLDVATRKKLIDQFKDREKDILRDTNIVLGGETDFETAVDELATIDDQIRSRTSRFKSAGSELFSEAESYTDHAFDEFDAEVAARERREDLIRDAGGFVPEQKPEKPAAKGAFDEPEDEGMRK